MIEYYDLKGNEWLEGLFNERHRWAPIYVRETFWAGMSTTQRSESMNSFFDGYVNSKTTLKQFVEQYDNALRAKIEKESMADFGSFNTKISCVSHFGFESQFQNAFTNAKFKEFQVEVACMMYCETCLENSEGSNSIFLVTESKKVYDQLKDTVFKVSFIEEDFKLQCTCCLFEFKGILCRHILCVLRLTRKTESVPPCYVLSRWRKDIKRRHTLIKCGSGQLIGNPQIQRINKACDAFYEVASTVINNEDDLLKVMSWIEDLKIGLTGKETHPGIIEEVAPRILDPAKVRSKGRPPSKRKASKIDQIVKKKLVQKKTQKRSQNSKNNERQEEVPSVTENEEHFRSQIINEIGTQESIQERYFQKSGTLDSIAPFNPNQEHNNEVNQAYQMSVPTIINRLL